MARTTNPAVKSIARSTYVRARKTCVVIVLRPAAVRDADAVARIYIESWNQGFGHLMGIRERTPEQTARWENDLANTEVEWTVAEIEGGVVGFVGVGPSRDPIDPALGELDTIAVDPGRWRQGVGRSLMDHALDRLGAGYSAAILWTVAGYERGHAFYIATGWEPLDMSRASGTEVAFGHSLNERARGFRL